MRIQPTANLQLAFGHRFLNESPFFENSSLYTAGAYYRINDNWAGGASARYEASTGVVEEQRYTIYRDLTSWVASVGAIIRNNGGVKEYGVLLTFTLKALPKFSFDLNFDPGAAEGDKPERPPARAVTARSAFAIRSLYPFFPALRPAPRRFLLFHGSLHHRLRICRPCHRGVFCGCRPQRHLRG